jgi:hypothetical protein
MRWGGLISSEDGYGHHNNQLGDRALVSTGRRGSFRASQGSEGRTDTFKLQWLTIQSSGRGRATLARRDLLGRIELPQDSQRLPPFVRSLSVAKRNPVSYLYNRRAGASGCLMLALIAIAALVGAALALRFKVFSLVPTTAFLLVIVAVGLVIRGDPIWWIGVVTFATTASLQFGYFAASLLPMLLLGKGRPTPISGDRQPRPAAPPLVPGEPDREITIEGRRSSDRTRSHS